MRVAVLICGLGFMLSGFGQSISGKVVDTLGHPIPFATIYSPGIGAGDASDQTGQFYIPFSNKTAQVDTLHIRCLGYKPVVFAYELRGNQRARIVLRPKAIVLSAFAVSPDMDAAELVRQTVKRVKRNYVQETQVHEGFYRELIFENGAARQLNECAFDLSYSPYPQKQLDKRVFHDYWNDYHTVSKYKPRGVLSDFAQHWPAFTSAKDQVNILQSRCANIGDVGGAGEYDYGSPLAGPVDLLAMDNLKYQRHVADPKLRKQYVFEHGDKLEIDGELCYAIHYKPKKNVQRYSHRWDKKDPVALYKGTLFITVNKLQLLRFTCETAFDKETLFGYAGKQALRDFRANDFNYTVRYAKHNGAYSLSQVDYVAHYNMTWNEPAVVRITRSLSLSPLLQKEFELNSLNGFPMRHESLRYRNTAYNPIFWQAYEQGKLYQALPSGVRADMNRVLPLDSQFEFANKTIEEIPLPNKALYTTSIFDEKHQVIDSNAFQYALQAENEYAKAVLSKTIADERLFVHTCNAVLKKLPDAETRKRAVGEHFTAQDSLGDYCYYEQLPDSLLRFKLNRTYESKTLGNGRIVDLQFGDSLACILVEQLNQPSKLLKIRSSYTHQIVDSILFANDVILLNDSQLLYTTMNAQGWINQLHLHAIGTSNTRVLYEEKNKEFDVELKQSTSDSCVFVISDAKERNQIYLYDANKENLRLISEQVNNEYQSPDHFAGNEFIYLKKETLNNGSSIFSFNLQNDELKRVHQSLSSIDDFYVAGSKLFLTKHWGFDMSLSVLDLKHQELNLLIQAKPQSISMYGGKPGMPLQIIQESTVTPPVVFSIKPYSGKLEEQYRHELGFWKPPSNLKQEIHEVLITDSVRIPCLFLFDKAAIKDSVTGLLVHGYGAYGGSVNQGFKEEYIAYARRGFVLAFPATRGSGALGRSWYYAGKDLNKRNTFSDFLAAVKFAQQKFGIGPEGTFAKGTSAGGIIMGVMANEAEDLFAGLIFDRPFLDVFQTMNDSLRYLTCQEYQEFGNPVNEPVNKLLKSYSPLDNMKPRVALNVLVRGSYFDQITPVAETLCYISKWRPTSSSLLLLRTRLNSGHQVPYNLKELGEEYGFMMHRLRQNEH